MELSNKNEKGEIKKVYRLANNQEIIAATKRPKRMYYNADRDLFFITFHGTDMEMAVDYKRIHDFLILNSEMYGDFIILKEWIDMEGGAGYYSVEPQVHEWVEECGHEPNIRRFLEFHGYKPKIK